MATSSVTATGFSSSFHGSWGTSIAGNHRVLQINRGGFKTTARADSFGKEERRKTRIPSLEVQFEDQRFQVPGES
ncbi:hypothetical protein Ccrd_021347 [Cynara cardunculus var. scolymus]|uniref:Uncharacterized protein n=1 Tax=Cynara cardunculus var. scolymus TaxID=59895 RepID=A0A103Y0U3_CYNCS|nr:hypothetical protein Ccrd_021347 [Cynara cardunculus var. scolymus]